MQYNSPVVRLVFFFSLAVLFLTSCKKVNEATELGGDLIPAVDNVNTFDTSLAVETFNYPFTTEDSARSVGANIQWLGRITQDPLFGTTTASMFLQLRPSVTKTPFAFKHRDTLIGLDSVVLVLSYRGIYGDSTISQQVQVFELDQSNTFRADSAYFLHQNNFVFPNPLSGVKTILPTQLNDSVRPFRELATNQLRIRLDDAFGNRLLQEFDSTNAYFSDSAFATRFKGFAVVPGNNGTGNALMGFSLSDTNTKLAVYYRYKKMGAPDTAVTYFRFTRTSASANYIDRSRSGSEFASVAGDNNADQLVYMENAPGTFTRIRIPGLASVSNRVVHRAELIMEQVPDPLSNLLTPPTYLYLDAYDVASPKVFRSIPLDVALSNLNSFDPAQPNYGSFGMSQRFVPSATGASVPGWRFVLTRYVQQVVNKSLPLYELRLSAPYYTVNRVGISTQDKAVIVNPNYAVGRVRLGGGSHPTKPMRLRIVYSKL